MGSSAGRGSVGVWAVNTSDAVALIRRAVPARAGTWADFGSGDGAFTRALVERIGPEGRVYAVDHDASAVAALGRWAAKEAPGVVPVVADFSRPIELPGLERGGLDGMLLANALHFVRDQAGVLRGLAAWLRPGGRVALVEYDRRLASRWVPFPIPATRWAALAADAGLENPVVTAARESAFGGRLYAAAADLPRPPLGATGEAGELSTAQSI